MAYFLRYLVRSSTPEGGRYILLFSRPNVARGFSTNTVVIKSANDPIPKNLRNVDAPKWLKQGIWSLDRNKQDYLNCMIGSIGRVKGNNSYIYIN